jgi:hypothetical protein
MDSQGLGAETANGSKKYSEYPLNFFLPSQSFRGSRDTVQSECLVYGDIVTRKHSKWLLLAVTCFGR